VFFPDVKKGNSIMDVDDPLGDDEHYFGTWTEQECQDAGEVAVALLKAGRSGDMRGVGLVTADANPWHLAAILAGATDQLGAVVWGDQWDAGARRLGAGSASRRGLPGMIDAANTGRAMAARRAAYGPPVTGKQSCENRPRAAHGASQVHTANLPFVVPCSEED
jgi:hypothetical protein